MVENTLLNNRYLLQEQTGSGGMAFVYRAYDQMLERQVAVKILRQDFSQDQAFRDRFWDEAKAAANLSHPNIVTIHDFGFSDGFPFIVMEYLAGPHLKRLVLQLGRLSIEQSVDLIIQACAGVGYAHRAGLVHCDLKPQNLIVTPDQRLKVTDFGIARALATINPNEQHEVVWGSPQYFAPEQAAGAPPSPASDVYSLGIVLYEMLTGRLPFTATDPDELARMHLEYEPPTPRLFNPDIPPALEEILLKVLAKEPASRYRTADQFGRILENLAFRSPEALKPAPDQRQAQESDIHEAPTQYIPAEELAGETENPLDVDWLSIGLGLLALIAVGGLIPFWLWVYYNVNGLLP